MPHSHTITGRVSVAWTINRLLGLRAGVGARAAVVESHTDYCCCSCIPVWSVIHCNLTPLQHSHCARLSLSQTTHELSGACCSRCCELIDTQALSTHRSRVLVRHQFSLPAYRRVSNFCHVFGRGNGGQLIRGISYTRVYTNQLNRTKC